MRTPPPVEAAGTVENAGGVSHRPLDGASGSAHTSHRLDGGGARKPQQTVSTKRGNSNGRKG